MSTIIKIIKSFSFHQIVGENDDQFRKLESAWSKKMKIKVKSGAMESIL